MSEFAKEDVIKVARALYDNAVSSEYLESGPNEFVLSCDYCSAQVFVPFKPHRKPNIKHGCDCPVLAAQDLLTGFEATP